MPTASWRVRTSAPSFRGSCAWVDPEKLGQRIAEGLDAIETKFCRRVGVVTDSRDILAYRTRLHYINIAVRYTGYYVDRPQGAVEQVPSEADDNRRIAELLALGAKQRSSASGSPLFASASRF